MRKRMRQKHIGLWIGLGTLVLLLGVFAWYVDGYYRATDEAWSLAASDDSVTVSERDGTLVFAPQKPIAGLVFYPGGKVQAEAYAPLLHACAARGVLCVLVQMPCNLAVLNGNAADAVIAQYPAVSDWYIGGHSLGGAMAAIYAAQHADNLSGLVLLASFSTRDLGAAGLKTLSVYGTKDGVLNREQYAACRSNLPADATEIVIEGGNHAGFGCYGSQNGDGEAELSASEQQRITADAILHLISEDGA